MGIQVGLKSDVKPKAQIKTQAQTSMRQQLIKRRRWGDEFIRLILLFCGLVSVLTTIGIVYVLGQETLLFLDSRAFVQAKAQIVDESQSALLAKGIAADQELLTLTIDGERVPFADGQFIQIGEEIVEVVEHGRTTITVKRGQQGTSAVSHDIDTQLLGLKGVQVLPLNELNADATDNVIELVENYGLAFSVGESIQLHEEVMRVTGVEANAITVERAVDDTTLAAHKSGEDAEAIATAKEVSLVEFFTGTKWTPQIGHFGVWPLLNATLIITFIAMLVSIPLGLGSAIFLSEYASPNVRAVLKPILEILAGIPTVVFGFFALTMVSPALRNVFGDVVQYYNMLSAGIVVGILIIPMVSSMSEDALSAVPMDLRQASYGLGATKLETTIKVVLPAATSGVMASFIIGTARAIGETMIVAVSAGSGPNYTFNVFEGAETITGHIARISGGDLSYNSIDYNSIFAIAMLLFVMTLGLNLIAKYVENRFREQY